MMRFRIARGFSLIELLIVISIISIISGIGLINFLEAQTRSKVARTRADLRTMMTALEAYRADYTDYPLNLVVPPLPDGPKTPEGVSAGYPVVPPQLTSPVAFITTLPREPFRLGDSIYNFRLKGFEEQQQSYNYFRIISYDHWWGYFQQGIFVPLPAVNAMPGDDTQVHFNSSAFSKYGEWVMIAAGPDKIFADWSADLGFDDSHYWYYEPYNSEDYFSLCLKAPEFAPWGYSFDIPYDPTNGTLSFGNLMLTQQGGQQPGARLTDVTTATQGKRKLGKEQSRGFSVWRIFDISSSAAAATSQARPRGGSGPTTFSLTTPRAGMRAPGVRSPGMPNRGRAPQRGPIPKAVVPGMPPLLMTAWILIALSTLLVFVILVLRLRKKPTTPAAKAAPAPGRLPERAVLRKMTEVDLSHSDVTDSALQNLTNLPRLETLSLWDTDITDFGISEMRDLGALHTLNLSETKVTDAGLFYLTQFPALRTLVLCDTEVSDEAVDELSQMSRLENLALRGTQVTREGVKQLRKALPRCTITHNL